jgi:hypothetical protein
MSRVSPLTFGEFVLWVEFRLMPKTGGCACRQLLQLGYAVTGPGRNEVRPWMAFIYAQIIEFGMSS